MSRILLILSLVTNVVLAAVLIIPRITTPAGDDASAATVRDHDAAAASTAGSTQATPGAGGTGIIAWENLPVRDLTALVARLRAAGFPPAAIRAVVTSLLGQEFNARRNELTAEDADKPFWQVHPFGLGRDRKAVLELQSLSGEHRQRLRELLGPDADDPNPEFLLSLRRRFGDLPPDTLRRVNDVVSDYDDLLNQVRFQGVLLPEDRERITYLEKEKRADLAKVLTPAELEELEMRTSNAATELRWQLSGFNPSREEFQAVYRAMLAVREKLGEVDSGIIRLGGLAKERQALMAEELKSALSPERLEEYQLTTDNRHAQTAQLVAKLQLPISVTKEIVAIQTDVTDQADAARKDAELTPDERKARLAALADDATSQLTEKLGPRGFEAYKQSSGHWLNGLSGQR